MYYAETKSNNQLAVKAENKQYTDAELIEIKVPVSMPYYTYTTTGYEPYHGQVTHNGITFQYVERKIENGYLYVKCLPSSEAANAVFAIQNYFAGSTDMSSENHDTPVKKINIQKAIDDFTEPAFTNTSIEPVGMKTAFSQMRNTFLPQILLHTPERPPAAV